VAHRNACRCSSEDLCPCAHFVRARDGAARPGRCRRVDPIKGEQCSSAFRQAGMLIEPIRK